MFSPRRTQVSLLVSVPRPSVSARGQVRGIRIESRRPACRIQEDDMVTDDRDSNAAPRAQDAAQNAAQEPAGGTPHDAPQHPIDDTLDVREARALADRMRRLAGSIARQQAQFLELLDEI